MTESTPTRVAPLAVLGRKRAFWAAQRGAALGVVWGVVIAAASAAAVGSQHFKPLVVFGLFIGVFLGPTLAVGVAGNLAVSGTQLVDFEGIPSLKCWFFGTAGGAVGAIAGAILGVLYLRVVLAGDILIFFFSQVGAIAGSLIPIRILTRKATNRRLTLEPK